MKRYNLPLAALLILLWLCGIGIGIFLGYAQGYNAGAKHATAGFVMAYKECVEGKQ